MPLHPLKFSVHTEVGMGAPHSSFCRCCYTPQVPWDCLMRTLQILVAKVSPGGGGGLGGGKPKPL